VERKPISPRCRYLAETLVSAVRNLFNTSKGEVKEFDHKDYILLGYDIMWSGTNTHELVLKYTASRPGKLKYCRK
jgi:hypothetical protein